jgi:hypothetical protein
MIYIEHRRALNVHSKFRVPSYPATGSRECAPDDRLRRGIQYAAPLHMTGTARVLDRLPSRTMTASGGDDGDGDGI